MELIVLSIVAFALGAVALICACALYGSVEELKRDHGERINEVFERLEMLTHPRGPYANPVIRKDEFDLFARSLGYERYQTPPESGWRKIKVKPCA